MSVTYSMWTHVVDVLLDPPPGVNPGTEPLPGEIGQKINTILGWVKYLATAAAVAGLLITAAMMAISHRRGDDSQVARLGWVLAACVLIGSAPWLVGALI